MARFESRNGLWPSFTGEFRTVIGRLSLRLDIGTYLSGRYESSPASRLGYPPPFQEGSSHKSSWSVMTEEMVRGRHHSDEATRS